MVSDAAELRRWSREQLDQLSSQICGGRTIHDRLRIVGTELAQRVLSRTGQKILASLYNTVDSVVIYGSNSEVPWELMCPPPEDEDLLPLLGSMWRTIRWPSDGDVTSLSLALADVQKPAQTMRTVGLGNHDSWRWKTPDDFDGLKGIARLGGTLHLVGRSTTDAFTPLDGSLDLNPQLVRSLGLRGPSSVILSACGEGAAEDLSRLAIAIGLQAGCPVWAPLVMAAQPQIDALDRALAEFVAANPKRSIEDFIADRRAAVPLLSLYACYGVNKPRKKAQYAHA
jgi:hypothetical protein